MYRVRVKICGITNIVDAQMAEREGADALGFVFYPQSPRAVTVQRVAEITRVLSPLTGKVGVFCDAATSDIEKTTRRCGLTGAQVCGETPGTEWLSLSRRVRMMRVLQADPETFPEAPPWEFCYDYMIMPICERIPGEEPETFDWSLIPENGDGCWGRIHISGGLTPDSIGDLIKHYRPYGVNVSMALDAENGRKDPVLVKQLFGVIHQAQFEVNQTLEEEKAETEPDISQPLMD